MRHLLSVGAAVLLGVAGSVCQAADIGTQYAVVKIVDFDQSTTNMVMSASEFKALQATVQAEALLFSRAIAAAADEWRKDETLRTQMFPFSRLGPRRVSASGILFDSKEQAAEALNKVSGQRLSGPKSQPSKANAEREEALAQAVGLVREELAALKRGSSSGGAVAVSTNKILLTAGQVLTRVTTGATKTSYHIAVPDRYDAQKPPPLLVVFSPGGDGKGMMLAVRAAANKVGWMVLGCDGLRNNMTEDDELRIEEELIRDIQEFVPYDPARLYYGGMSGGAQRAYQMTHLFRNCCAGILAFGGWIGGPEEQKKPFQRNMAVAMVNGDSDKGATSWEGFDMTALKRRGCKVKAFHFSGGHVIGPPETIDAAVAWLDQQAGGVANKPPAHTR